MNFFETVMGKRFYEGTMPSIARSLEALANSRKAETTEGGYISADTQEMGEDNGMIRIVAENSRHEMEAVAIIDDLTSRVIYLVPAAKTDSSVQSVIRKKLEELDRLPVSVSRKHDLLSLNLYTPLGTVSATAEPDNDGMYISRTNFRGNVIDLASVREQDGGLLINVWSDPVSEDPVPKEPFWIPADALQELDLDHNDD